MTADPLVLAPEVERATARLVETASTLDGGDLESPSLCRGWSRGHVLTHVARNADSFVNLITWARTGIETPQYPSRAKREADIEAGSGRPIDEQLADLGDSAARLLAAVDAMTPADWTVRLHHPNGDPLPAAGIVWSRLREVEVHHIDLAAGYAAADWSPMFSRRLLHEVCANLAGAPGFALTARLTDGDTDQPVIIGPARSGGPTVSGPTAAVAAWLIGRGDGAELTAPGGLPPVPDWK